MTFEVRKAKGYFLEDWPLLDQLVSGFAAGGTATLVLHPLDLLKTRFQATTTNENRAKFAVARELSRIYRAGGIKGLYRGFSANFTGSTLSWGLYFLLYRWIQHQWESPLVGWQYFISAGSAGMLTVLATNPIWLAKTRLCQPGPQIYTGLIDCLRRTVKAEGVSGLYRGLIPGLIGTSHGAVQFLTYESLKGKYREMTSGKLPSVPEYLLMSSVSKVTASTVTYPYQVARCRLQMSGGQYASLGDVITKTFRNEGIAGFYKGIAPSTIRVLPGTCITFLVYEKLSDFFRNNAQ